MRRVLVICGLFLAVTLTSIAVLVNLRSDAAGELPPPDPALPITLADGSELPLSEVLHRLRNELPLPLAPPHAPASLVAPASPSSPMASVPSFSAVEAALVEARGVQQVYVTSFGPTFALADSEEHAGRLDQALALYQSIGEDEPGYAYARRRIGWHILADAKGQPARGVPYVHEALREEPFNGNSWQDLARVYGRTLGLPID